MAITRKIYLYTFAACGCTWNPVALDLSTSRRLRTIECTRLAPSSRTILFPSPAAASPTQRSAVLGTSKKPGIYCLQGVMMVAPIGKNARYPRRHKRTGISQAPLFHCMVKRLFIRLLQAPQPRHQAGSSLRGVKMNPGLDFDSFIVVIAYHAST